MSKEVVGERKGGAVMTSHDDFVISWRDAYPATRLEKRKNAD
jgi:hypothetical protein